MAKEVVTESTKSYVQQRLRELLLVAATPDGDTGTARTKFQEDVGRFIGIPPEHVKIEPHKLRSTALIVTFPVVIEFDL